MKRLRKILLITLGVVVLLLISAVAGLNMYLRSPSNRGRISDELSKLLHIPLQITSISIGLHGTEINGLQIPEQLDQKGAARLDAKSFSAKYRILPLLNHQFIVKTMVLDSPALTFVQNEEGKFTWPKLPARLKKPKTDEEKKKPEEKPEDLEVLIESLVIKNGSVELRDINEKPFAEISGVEMNFKMTLAKSAQLRKDMRTVGRIEGKIAAQKLATPIGLVFEDVHSSLVLDQGNLSLPDFHARLGGGDLQATLMMPIDKKEPFDLQLTLAAVDLARVASDAGWKDRGLTAGTLDANLSVQSTLKAVKNGEGRVSGKLSSPAIRTPIGIVFEDVSASLLFDQNKLSLPDFQAKLGGGDLQVQLALPLDSKAPFDLKMKLAGMDLAKLLADAKGPKVSAAGTVNGKLTGTGTLKDLRHAEGEGELTLTDGAIHELGLVQMIALVLGFPELADLRVRTGKVGFHVNKERATLDKLVLETSDLRISTKGNIEFDGGLDLKAKLGLSPALADRLGHRSANLLRNFDAPDAEGRRTIGFNITGQADHPKTDLGTKLISGQLGGMVQELVFGDKKDKKDKDRDKDKEKRKKKEKEEKDKAAPTTGNPPETPAPEPAAAPPAPTAKPATPAEP